jgi:trimethylamine--corrinoid protein Co-methyltransferase
MMEDAVLKLSFMDPELIEEIHEATLSVLEETGIMIDSEKVYKVLKREGIDVQVIDQKRGKTFWRVRFGRDVIAKALKTAPKKIMLASRNSKHDLLLDGKGSVDSVFFGTWGMASMIHDIDTGERRLGTLEDLAKFHQVASALEGIDFCLRMLTPRDPPHQVMDLSIWKTVFENQPKHVIGTAAYDVKNLPFLIEMAAAVVGGEDELRRRPIFSVIECPVAPLYFSERVAENTIDIAKAGIPLLTYPEPFAGATSPVTLAGALVVTNAESLAGIALTQIANPGSPVIKASAVSVMDLRTGNISLGAAETGLLNVATAEMARFYGIPSSTTGGRTDSKVADCQSGFERQSNLLLAALAGSNLNIFAGELESTMTTSASQLVIDDEIIKRTKRFLRGFSINKETLAVNEIRQVGPGGQYLGHEHTLRHMRNEILIPNISSKGSYEEWISKGGLDLEKVAREKVQEILRTHKPQLLDDQKSKELERILREAKKMHGITK